MKKGLYIIICITFFILGFLTNAVIKGIQSNSIEEKAKYNRCVSTLINYDDIEKGCDKYFLNDKWYNNYMNDMFKEYEKIR